MTKDYSKTNPVPQRGDKIQITAVNNSQAREWKVGDIVECIDGTASYWNKPAFSAYVKRYQGCGDYRREFQRKVWCGPNSYDWKIVERGGVPFVDPEQQRKAELSQQSLRRSLKADVFDLVMHSESLLSKMVVGDGGNFRAEQTSKNIMSLTESLVDEYLHKDLKAEGIIEGRTIVMSRASEWFDKYSDNKALKDAFVKFVEEGNDVLHQDSFV